MTPVPEEWRSQVVEGEQRDWRGQPQDFWSGAPRRQATDSREVDVDIAEITQKVRQIVAKVTSIPAETIGADANLREELGLDSLSLLEVGVNVDYEFKLNLPDLDQRMAGITTVASAVTLVEELLRERAAAAVPA